MLITDLTPDQVAALPAEIAFSCTPRMTDEEFTAQPLPWQCGLIEALGEYDFLHPQWRQLAMAQVKGEYGG